MISQREELLTGLNRKRQRLQLKSHLKTGSEQFLEAGLDHESYGISEKDMCEV